MILIIKHIEIEGPGTLGEFFNNQTSWKIKIVELENGEILPSLGECEAVISLGGLMNVYETNKYPFLEIEEDFLREALDKEIPVLGICLGAQLLAKVAGAEIKKAEQEEIGWYKVNLTEEGIRDTLFYNLGKSLEVFQWHENTFEIPQGGILLATSDTCRNQAVRIGRCAWALQFHLEMTPEMLETWLNYYPVDLDKYKLLVECFKKREIYQRQANLIYFNFAQIIANRTKSRVRT